MEKIVNFKNVLYKVGDKVWVMTPFHGLKQVDVKQIIICYNTGIIENEMSNITLVDPEQPFKESVFVYIKTQIGTFPQKSCCKTVRDALKQKFKEDIQEKIEELEDDLTYQDFRENIVKIYKSLIEKAKKFVEEL